jgi:hypothetical protein
MYIQKRVSIFLSKNRDASGKMKACREKNIAGKLGRVVVHKTQPMPLASWRAASCAPLSSLPPPSFICKKKSSLFFFSADKQQLLFPRGRKKAAGGSTAFSERPEQKRGRKKTKRQRDAEMDVKG